MNWLDNVLETEKKEVENIDIRLLMDFHTGEMKHPFKIEKNADMLTLMEDIKNNGILEPILVRRDTTFPEKYEIIAGHRRRFCAEELGIEEVPCIVLELNDEKAIKTMVVTNTAKRSKILPSEKAKAFKAFNDANKSEYGNRKNLTEEEIGKDTGEEAKNIFQVSRRNFYNHLKLNDLNEDLLKLVDEGILSVVSGADLSTLSEELQKKIFNEYEMQFREMVEKGKKTILTKKIASLKKEKEENITDKKLKDIFGSEKNQSAILHFEEKTVETDAPKVKKTTINERWITDYLPPKYKKEKTNIKQNYVKDAVCFYNNLKNIEGIELINSDEILNLIQDEIRNRD